MTKSFPDKSASEIKELIKGAYRNFCDILLEGVKGLGMSDQQLVKRFKVQNPELLNDFFEKNQDVVLCASHYCNWEWGITLGLQFPHLVVVPYKPVKNKYINAFIEKSRSFENLTAIPKNDTYRFMEKASSKARCLTLIADQSPANPRTAHWLPFLNQDTAFLRGPDTIARKYNLPVLNLEVQRQRRGQYEVTLSILQEHSISTKEEEITQIYARTLEKQIINKPENWLWTHRRWKKTRPSVIDF